MSQREWPEGFHEALMRYANARGEYFIRTQHRVFSHRQKFDPMTDDQVAEEMDTALRSLHDWFQKDDDLVIIPRATFDRMEQAGLGLSQALADLFASTGYKPK